MTERTPVMRYTALSRPHARSAKELPIATMKATYVVDKGNLRDVPNAISNPERTTFTDARTKSNAAPLSNIISLLLKRLSTHSFTGMGTMWVMVFAEFMQTRTRTRATGEVPKFSSPSDCRAKSTDVFTTFCAFLDVSRAITMMMPDPNRKYQGVLADPCKEVIRNESGETVPCCAMKSL